jgi:transposase
MRHGLTDEQWNAIEDIFPEPAATGRLRANPRKMLDAMIWINNTGAKWRDLPPELGAWQTVFKHFDRWNDDGRLQSVVDRLNSRNLFGSCGRPEAIANSCSHRKLPRISIPGSSNSDSSVLRIGLSCQRCDGGADFALKSSSRKVMPTPPTPPILRRHW